MGAVAVFPTAPASPPATAAAAWTRQGRAGDAAPSAGASAASAASDSGGFEWDSEQQSRSGKSVAVAAAIAALREGPDGEGAAAFAPGAWSIPARRDLSCDPRDSPTSSNFHGAGETGAPTTPWGGEGSVAAGSAAEVEGLRCRLERRRG